MVVGHAGPFEEGNAALWRMIVALDVAAVIQTSTSRAKSDVANKLISMFLHAVSRRIAARIELSVRDVRYGEMVKEVFGISCLYCGRELEADRLAVEHMDGMNRFRCGLHLPGNVAIACKKCNTAKRHDDSLPELKLAQSGWESFLSHDGTRCAQPCRTCAYWAKVFVDTERRTQHLSTAIAQIRQFRAQFKESLDLAERLRGVLLSQVQTVYRDCQKFADDEIQRSIKRVDEVL